MLSLNSCTCMVIPLLLTSLRIGWSHNFEHSIATQASPKTQMSIRADVSESAIELTIDNSSESEQHKVLDQRIDALTVNEELLSSMENPQIAVLDEEGNELSEDDMKNAHLSFPLKLRLGLVQGKSKHSMLFQLLGQHTGLGMAHQRERWWRKVKNRIKEKAKIVKKHVGKLKNVVVVKAVKHGKEAMQAIKKCASLPAISCIANQAFCPAAISKASKCLKEEAAIIKVGVVKSAQEIKKQAQESAGIIKEELTTEAEKIKGVLAEEVQKTIARQSTDVRIGVDALVDKATLSLQKVDHQFGSNLSTSIDVGKIRAAVLSAVTDIEKEALSQQAKMVGDTGESLGELKGRTESQVKKGTDSSVSKIDAGKNAVTEKTEGTSVAAMIDGQSLLNTLLDRRGESEGKGAVHPMAAIFHQAGLIKHDRKAGSKSKRKRLMRQSVSWKGSFE